MSPDPTVELRGFGGSVQRERPVLELRAGALDGTAKVTPLGGLRGRRFAAGAFEVSASWHGPPMEGFAPNVGGAPLLGGVDATDTYVVEDLELAKAIAMAAIDELRASRAPDLRALYRRLSAAK